MPASNQTKHKTIYTLYPSFLALVPYESITGPNPTVKSFADITKENSIIFNQIGTQGNYIINEEGVDIVKTKTSVGVRALVSTGLGDVDDVTNERTLTVTINVNGHSHELDAILDGSNPLVDVTTNARFSKNEAFGEITSIAISNTPGEAESPDGTYQLSVDNTGTGGTGFAAQITIVSGVITGVTIVNPGSGYLLPPIVTSGETFSGDAPVFTLTVGKATASAGYVPKENLTKQKWTLVAVSETGNSTEGSIYTLCPKLVVQDQDIPSSRKSDKVSTVIQLKGLLILDPAELALMQRLYSGVKSSELVYTFNAANIEYSEA